MGYSIDWLPDGRLLMTGDKLRRQETDGSMGTLAEQRANEIVVDGGGNIYLNGADFNFSGGEAPKPGYIKLITPDGQLRQVSEPPAQPPPAGEPERAGWAHPALTGLAATEWDKLIGTLTTPHELQREAALYVARGGPPTRRPAGGHPRLCPTCSRSHPHGRRRLALRATLSLNPRGNPIPWTRGRSEQPSVRFRPRLPCH